MSYINTLNTFFGKISCLVFTFVITASALAQEQGGLLRVYEMALKPESVEEWETLQRDEAIPALLEGGYDWVEVWGPGGAGDVYYRSLIVPIDNLDELDEPTIFQRVLGPEKANDLIERNNSMVNSINALIVRTRPELSFGSPPEVPGVGVLTKVTVANGRTGEFERRLRGSVASELRESNVQSFRVSQVLYGGDVNQYFTLLEFQRHENDDVVRASPLRTGHPSALEWALGTVGVARVAEQRDSPIVSINRVVLKHDDELSSR